jgi:hypothetical protein
MIITYNLPPPTNITNMFGNWLNGIPKADKTRICIGVSALCWSIWSYGHVKITSRRILIFSRLFGWLCTRFIYGPTSSQWIIGSLWLMDATGCWQLLKTCFSRLLDDGILIELKMDSVLSLLIFRWLIYVSTLADQRVGLCFHFKKNVWPCMDDTMLIFYAWCYVDLLCMFFVLLNFCDLICKLILQIPYKLIMNKNCQNLCQRQCHRVRPDDMTKWQSLTWVGAGSMALPSD